MHGYQVVIERAARNFSGYVPDLPGCVATAKTEEETRLLLDEAIALHLEAMRENGDPIPVPSRGE